MVVSRKLIGLGTFVLSCVVVTAVAVAVVRLSPGRSLQSTGAPKTSLHISRRREP